MSTPYSDHSYGMPAKLPQGMAVSSLVLGIVGLLLACLAFGAVFGIVAVILGIMALGRVKRGVNGGRGLAIAGIVTGALAILGGIVAGIVWVSLGSLGGDVAEACMSETDPVAQQRCIEEQVESRFS